MVTLEGRSEPVWTQALHCPTSSRASAVLVPSQNSSGGKARLERITKRGDVYLRTLLIQGAKSVVMSAAKRSDRTSQWVLQLKERVGWQKAVVALANKLARICYATLRDHAPFDEAARLSKKACRQSFVMPA